MHIEFDRDTCIGMFQCVDEWAAFEENRDDGKADLDGGEETEPDLFVRDVPEEAAETGDFPNHEADALTPFSAVLDGNKGRAHPEEVLVVASVGTAVLDVATAELVYETAVNADVGTETTL